MQTTRREYEKKKKKNEIKCVKEVKMEIRKERNETLKERKKNETRHSKKDRKFENRHLKKERKRNETLKEKKKELCFLCIVYGSYNQTRQKVN